MLQISISIHFSEKCDSKFLPGELQAGSYLRWFGVLIPSFLSRNGRLKIFQNRIASYSTYFLTSEPSVAEGVDRRALVFRREGPGFESLSWQCRKCDGARLTHLMLDPKLNNCLSFLYVSDSISTQKSRWCSYAVKWALFNETYMAILTYHPSIHS